MSIYTKTVDGWVPIVGGVAFGTPGAPTITNPEGGSVISFVAGTEGDAGQTLAYGSIITPNDNGETVVVDEQAMEVVVSGTQTFTDYVVSVYGVNLAGKGSDALTSPFQLNYNEATGGTETVVDDYNGTGETWKVHDFTSSGTFSVTESVQIFRTMTAGAGGGAGGPRADYYYGGGSGGIGVGTINDAHVLTPQSYAVTVGTGGAGGGTGGSGSSGGSSTINSQVSAGGGGGAVGQSPMPTPVPNGPSVTTDISGSSVTYGGAGGASNGGAGGAGKVIVAYQIGTSSTAQIRNAVAVREADNAGFERGMVEGRDQRNQEIVEAMQLEQEKFVAPLVIEKADIQV